MEQPGSEAARRKKLFSLCDHLGLTRNERIDVARTILHRDVMSYTELSLEQVNRMLDALEGAILIEELRRQRLTIPATQP